MKNVKWLDELAEKLEQKKTAGRTKVASKVETNDMSVEPDMIVMTRDKLAGAVVGNTVGYRNAGWKVVNASYKDAIGEGVVLKRIVAAIDEKKLTDAPERACTDPGDVYDYNVRETSEVPDFQAAAAATEQAIAADAAHDITTPKGRCTNDEVVATEPAAEPVVEEVVEPTVEEVVEPVTEEVVEEVVEPEIVDADPFEGALDDINEQPKTEVVEEVIEEEPAEEKKDEKKEEAAVAQPKRENVFARNAILKNIIASAKQ